MRNRTRFAFAAALMIAGTAANAASMTVIKSPSCGCCSKWVEHVRAHGFDVNVDGFRDGGDEVPDMSINIDLVAGEVIVREAA